MVSSVEWEMKNARTAGAVGFAGRRAVSSGGKRRPRRKGPKGVVNATGQVTVAGRGVGLSLLGGGGVVIVADCATSGRKM